MLRKEATIARLRKHDELFERPEHLKIFISAQMRGEVLTAERKAAAGAVEAVSGHGAWLWERDAHAGPYSSESVCLGHARTSDGLVLIISQTLTAITRQEYQEAKQNGAPCYIFLKGGYIQDDHTSKFISNERSHAVTRNFGNVSELQTQITDALIHHAVQASRRETIRRRKQRSSARRLRITEWGR